MRRRSWILSSSIALAPIVVVSIAASLVACGTTELIVDLPDGAVADTAYDASVDTSPPFDSFVPIDSGVDSTRDTAIDSGHDSGIDSGHDSGIDTRPPPCPVAEPAPFGACFIEGQSCGWNSACGGVDRGVCTKGAWSMTTGACPPPVPACPFPRPAPGTACPTASDVCVYGNACGGVSSARCVSGKWVIADFPCKPDCPAAAPVIGSACPVPPPTSATCGYTFGPTCSFACLCWKDAWSCYGTPCTDPPTGSGLDGGTD